jgi:plasmid stability protein
MSAMANLTIRNLDDDVKARLKIEAARHGRSMEEEIRHILRRAVAPSPREQGLGSRIVERFGALGGCELSPPGRQEPPRSPDFDE